MTATIGAGSGARLVAVVCTAQIFVQIGAGFWPALLVRWVSSTGLMKPRAADSGIHRAGRTTRVARPSIPSTMLYAFVKPAAAS